MYERGCVEVIVSTNGAGRLKAEQSDRSSHSDPLADSVSRACLRPACEPHLLHSMVCRA